MASDDEDDETKDPTYEYDTRSDVTDDYPALSDDGTNAPSSFFREGIEPWYPLDTVFNYRRYHVRQLNFAVRSFEKGRTSYDCFAHCWAVNHLWGFLPIDPTKNDPGDPWVITKKELQRILRLAYPKESGMEERGYAEEVRMMTTALPHAPDKLPKCHKVVDPENNPECKFPLGLRGWQLSWNLPPPPKPVIPKGKGKKRS